MLSSGKQNDIDVAGREGVCSCSFFFCSTGSSACCRLNTSCCSLLPLSSALQRLSWQRYGGEAQRCRVEGHPQHVHKRYGEGSQGITYSVWLLPWGFGYLADLLVYAATGLFVLKLSLR